MRDIPVVILSILQAGGMIYVVFALFPEPTWKNIIMYLIPMVWLYALLRYVIVNVFCWLYDKL